MNILIIGGTRFLGRHLVEAALTRGHRVTLFNRGRSNPNLFQQVETIHGDREKDLALLDGRSWDVVIDTCGYFPRIVRMSAEALRDKVRRYIFISSISVYADFSQIGLREDAPLGTIRDESVEEITNETYGPLKVLCEQAVQRIFGARATTLRPGLIVGPHDISDRFTYWPVRIARGGDVLVPDQPEALTRIIDVRDLAGFIIQLAEQDTSGIFNATGQTVTLGTLFETCKRAANSNAQFKWASVDFLAQHNVSPWSDMPAWVPDTGEDAGIPHMDDSKAIAAGLVSRDLSDIVKDTLAWASTRPPDHEWRAGLTPEREKELLDELNHVP